MSIATSQGNTPFLAELTKKLPATAADWQKFVSTLQAWQRSLQAQVWQAPTLLNSWVNYGSPYENAGYYLDAFGRVHLRGLIKSGTVGAATPVFTLPASYAPPSDAIYPVASNGAYGDVYVYTSGNVSVLVGSNAWVSLAGISWGISP